MSPQDPKECKWMIDGLCMKRTMCVTGVFHCPDFTPKTESK